VGPQVQYGHGSENKNFALVGNQIRVVHLIGCHIKVRPDRSSSC
jgi:hypothetical protein